MKRQLLSLLVTLLSVLSASAYDFEVDGIYYNKNEDGVSVSVTYATTNEYGDPTGQDYSCSVTIPSTVTYDGVTFSVTSIGESAFDCCTNLTSVTLPESLTSIGLCAFYECSSLTSVTLPKGVNSIGREAFRYCSSLTSINIPEGVTSISDKAFGGCSSLTSITLPASVTSIGFEAFKHTGLSSVIIPGSVTSISDGAFEGCSSLTSVTIPQPASLYRIGNGVFNSCSSLEAFYGRFASEDNRCLIAYGALEAFAPAGLTSYTLPQGVTSIGTSCFSGCSSLTSLTLPASVTSIGYDVFRKCSSLTEITSLNTTPPSCQSGSFDNFPISACDLYVPAESVEAYKAAYQWRFFTNIVGLTEEELIALGIQSAPSLRPATMPAYTLSGLKAAPVTKGIVIRGGKKVLVK